MRVLEELDRIRVKIFVSLKKFKPQILPSYKIYENKYLDIEVNVYKLFKKKND